MMCTQKFYNKMDMTKIFAEIFHKRSYNTKSIVIEIKAMHDNELEDEEVEICDSQIIKYCISKDIIKQTSPINFLKEILVANFDCDFTIFETESNKILEKMKRVENVEERISNVYAIPLTLIKTVEIKNDLQNLRISCTFVYPQIAEEFKQHHTLFHKFRFITYNGEICTDEHLLDTVGNLLKPISQPYFSYFLQIEQQHQNNLDGIQDVLKKCCSTVIDFCLKNLQHKALFVQASQLSQPDTRQMYSSIFVELTPEEIPETQSQPQMVVIDLDDIVDEDELNGPVVTLSQDYYNDLSSIDSLEESVELTLYDSKIDNIVDMLVKCEEWLQIHEHYLTDCAFNYLEMDKQIRDYVPTEGLAKEMYKPFKLPQLKKISYLNPLKEVHEKPARLFYGTASKSNTPKIESTESDFDKVKKLMDFPKKGFPSFKIPKKQPHIDNLMETQKDHTDLKHFQDANVDTKINDIDPTCPPPPLWKRPLPFVRDPVPSTSTQHHDDFISNERPKLLNCNNYDIFDIYNDNQMDYEDSDQKISYLPEDLPNDEIILSDDDDPMVAPIEKKGRKVAKIFKDEKLIEKRRRIKDTYKLNPNSLVDNRKKVATTRPMREVLSEMPQTQRKYEMAMGIQDLNLPRKIQEEKISAAKKIALERRERMNLNCLGRSSIYSNNPNEDNSRGNILLQKALDAAFKQDKNIVKRPLMEPELFTPDNTFNSHSNGLHNLDKERNKPRPDKTPSPKPPVVPKLNFFTEQSLYESDPNNKDINFDEVN